MTPLPLNTGQRPVSAGNLAAAAILLAAIAIITWIACSLLGHYNLDWAAWQRRAYRLAVAATVGAGLAVAGAALQNILQTPLADPFVLGISPGASAGMILALTLGPAIALPDWASAPVAAMAGALLTCLAVLTLSRRGGQTNAALLTPTGLTLCAMNGMILLSLLLFTRQHDLASFIGWSLGKLPNWLWDQPQMVIFCTVWITGGWGVLLFRAGAMDAPAVQAEPPVVVSTGWLRTETLIVASLMTAAAAALAGPVGFAGLLVPVLCRKFLRPNHRLQLIFCGFAGAIFLMLADTLCRLAGEWASVGEIPVGIVTALCGIPLFIFMLRRQ